MKGVMENLARKTYDPEADLMVRQELLSAGIPVINVGGVMDSDVKTRYIGILNGFIFRRGADYWSVVGIMPMDHARDIYQAYGKLGIKAGGKAGDGNPERAWVREGPSVKNVLLEFLNKCACVPEFIELVTKEVREQPDTFRYVKYYHVDSFLGLCKLSWVIRIRNIHSEIMEE